MLPPGDAELNCTRINVGIARDDFSTLGLAARGSASGEGWRERERERERERRKGRGGGGVGRELAPSAAVVAALEGRWEGEVLENGASAGSISNAERMG